MTTLPPEYGLPSNSDRSPADAEQEQHPDYLGQVYLSEQDAPTQRRMPTWLISVGSLIAGATLVIVSPGITAQIRESWSSSTPAASTPSTKAPLPAATSVSSSRRSTNTIDFGVGVSLIETTSATSRGAGTGMVIRSDGLVLTNYHVVQSTTTISATIAESGKQYTATMLGYDASRDVALLKLRGASSLATVKTDDDELKVGDQVTGVGNSNGQGYLSSKTGKITGLSAVISTTNETSPRGVEKLTGVIESTTAAVSGDSGGPLFDSEGEVVGITTAGRVTNASASANQAMSYAVPIDTALSVAEKILANDESGSVTIGPRSWLGVTIPITREIPLAHHEASGIQISGVEDDGPAGRAGITAGSVITRLDGKTLKNLSDLPKMLDDLEPGTKTTVTWTDPSGKSHTAAITTIASPVN